MPVERLQKILSHAGVASRRVAEEMILAGRVAVNGKVVAELGGRADTETDEITVDGVLVNRGAYRYFALNKPTGFVTTASDELDRETVLDLVPIGEIQLHPVGRLDADSEGLLVLTNDGTLTRLLTRPEHEVEKEYLVGVDSAVAGKDLQRFIRGGVTSEGELLRAASARAVTPPGDEGAAAPAWYLVVLKEGKKRQVRRMFAAVGRRVVTLRRVRIGPLHLGGLGSGAFRELTEPEVEALYQAAKDAPARRL